MHSSPSRLASDLCRTSIEDMLEEGRSFGDVEQRIASSGLSDDERAELWLFGWQAWSSRLRDLRAAGGRGGRLTRFASRAAARRDR
ncbi:MAG TPA: hypothetical protein VGY97_13465 [Solirubrobacteraceae bacterium]|jgi:hypothetical protein|nr:hypothetical protein [Solirubrobacteraceae bacterium]